MSVGAARRPGLITVADSTLRSLRRRAYGSATTPPEIDVPTVGRGSSAGDVVRHVIAMSTARLIRSERQIRGSEDPECVHEARVAVRRLRSELRTFLPLLSRRWACALREKLRWLGGELGAARDADVVLGRLRADVADLAIEDIHDGMKVLEPFARARAAARHRLLLALGEPRYVRLREELVDAAKAPRLAPGANKPASAELPKLVFERWKRVRERVEALGPDPTDAELHRIRIGAKHCRYAAEAVALVVGKPARTFAGTIKRVQTRLGRLQDAVIAQKRLRRYARRSQASALVRRLLEVEAGAAERARKSWRKAWRKASKKRLRSWI